MKVFVTGANGFIGSHLVELLLTKGHNVTGLVRPMSDLRSLAPLFARYPDRLRLVVGDLREPGTLGSGLADTAIVFHLAAVLMGTSETEFRDSICRGTVNLVDVVRQSIGGSLQRFLYVSSLAAAGPSPTPQPIDETAAPRPVSWYGTAKRDTEEMLRRLGTEQLPFTIVRPSAVYGEREQDISRSTFPAVRLGVSPRIGLGEKTVSFVYVGDLVAGILQAATSSDTVGKIFFLSNPRCYASGEIMSAVADAMKKRIRIPVVTPLFLLRIVAFLAEFGHLFTRGRPMLTRDKFREVRQRNWACTADSAFRIFGWKAGTDLTRGMSLAVRDWEARREETRSLAEPVSDRVIETYTIALFFGVLTESVAKLGSWYDFGQWWYVLVVVVGVFGGIMGTLSYLSARSSVLMQFSLGAAVGIGAELLNAFALHAWVFRRFPFGWIAHPVLRALAAGLPAGLMPILVTAIVRALYDQRRRLG